jgi:Gpi18-like mannosyltransferase
MATLFLPRAAAGRPTFGVLPVLVAAAVVYAAFWPLMGRDIWFCYVPWLEHLAHDGPLRALGTPFGDYTPPYYYMLSVATPLVGLVPSEDVVKLVSLAGTLLLAGAVLHLARALRLPRAELVAAAVLLLPGVALNTALMGQCDAMSTAPLVMAVAAVIERRTARMFLWCGVAAAVKAQAVFCAPFFLAMAIRHHAPWREWLLAPAATLAMFAPAMILGWPLSDLLTVYVRQAGFYDTLSMNAPNVWAIVQAFPLGLPLTGLANATAVGAAAAYAAHFGTRPLSDRATLAAAALAPLIVVGLLPRMHERYFYAADVLVFVWAAAAGRRSAWVTAGLVQLGSLLAILGYGRGLPALPIVGAVAMLAATWRLGKPLLARAANDDAPSPPPA